jgi:Domain of unknown function (DUF2017)
VGNDGAVVSRLFIAEGDHIKADLSVEDKALLVQIPDLIDSVEEGVGDPAYAVLNRAAHGSDEDASADFADLVRSERDRDQEKDLDVLVGLTSNDSVLTQDAAKAVLRAINAARLTLAARSGAFEEGSAWELRVSEDPALAAVAWLGYVQSDLIAAIMKCSEGGV